MDVEQQRKFINDLLENQDIIIEEYLNFNRRRIPLSGWDEDKSKVDGWSGVALWWDHKQWPSSQRRCPATTELVRNGPEHRATGWLVLESMSRTPEHNHEDWGKRKIILHLPCVLPEGESGFVVEGKTYHWKMGELFAFDALKNHYGYNNTNESRSIFVLDFDYDEWYEVLKDYMRI